MKFSKYFMLAGAAALLTACSSEEPVVSDVTNYPVSAEVANNDCYLPLSIALAQSEGNTRAVSYVDEGLPSEYSVLNSWILIFETESGKSESEAKYVDRFRITTSWADETTNNHISRYTTSAVAFPKGTFKEGSSYSAAIVLNAPSNYPWPKAAVVDSEGNETTPASTFGAWSTTASDVTFLITEDGVSYMTMVSAPNYNSTSKRTMVLQPLDLTKAVDDLVNLSSTAEPAASFFVHRVAAKVTLNADGDDSEEGVYTIEGTGATVTVTAWAADGVASTAYPIQNIGGFDLSKKSFYTTNTGFTPSFTRCNWSKSVFYDKETLAANDLAWKTSLSDESTLHAVEYIKENTMTHTLQVKNHTTRVLVKGVYQLPGSENPEDLIRAGVSGSTNTIWTASDFTAEVKSKAVACWTGHDADDITVTLKSSAKKAGNYTLTDMFDIKAGEATPDATTLDRIARELGLGDTNASAEKTIAYFANGVCYYTALIRHFDDQEAPLTAYPQAGTDYTEDQVGRYGVLRNNWYEVNVTSINRIGSPVPPTPTPTPDDEEKDKVDAMNVNIYMINWAKHSQNADF